MGRLINKNSLVLAGCILILCVIYPMDSLATFDIVPKQTTTDEGKSLLRIRDTDQNSTPHAENQDHVDLYLLDDHILDYAGKNGVVIDPGYHLLKIVRPGAEPYMYRFYIRSGEILYIDPVFVANERQTATLAIKTDPKEARIEILKPHMAFHQAMELPSGKYLVQASLEGYHRKRRWITLDPKSDIELYWALTPMESSPLSKQPCLSIDANIKKSNIYIDGKWIGQIPQPQITIAPGKHHIIVRKRNFVTYQKDIIIISGRSLSLYVDLVMKTIGRLFMETVPAGADIDIAGQKRNFYQGMELKPGKYHAKISSPGYKSRDIEFIIHESTDTSLMLSLDKLTSVSKNRSGKNDLDMLDSRLSQRYFQMGDNVVYDAQTGLEWLKGPKKNIGFQDVLLWIDGVNKQRKGDWRIPLIKELKTLYSSSDQTGLPGAGIDTKGISLWSIESDDNQNGYLFNYQSGQKIAHDRKAFFNLGFRVYGVRSTNEPFKGNQEI